MFVGPAARAAAGPAPRKAPVARSKGPREANGASGNDVRAPMHGVVVEVGVAAGDEVSEGQVVAVIEAMKMMNEIRAHRAGTVDAVLVERGATVEPRAALLRLR